LQTGALMRLHCFSHTTYSLTTCTSCFIVFWSACCRNFEFLRRHIRRHGLAKSCFFFLRFQTSRDFAGLRKSYNWLVWRNTRCIENCIWRALQVYEVYMSDFGRILHFHCILVFWTPSRHLKALSWRPGWKPSTCCLFSTGRLCSSLCKGNAHSHDASGAFKSSCACKSCKQAR
jgi:hypothetical protein